MDDRPESTSSDRADRVRETLAAFGAPLLGWRPVASEPLESALVQALVLSHRDATLLRVLPVVVARNRRSRQFARLRELARTHGAVAELGMLLDLTGSLLGDASLTTEAKNLEQGRPAILREYFASPGPFGRAVAERHTPAAARRWGFVLNMSEDVFASLLRKAGA